VRIECLRLNHFNVVLKDFAASLEHFDRLYDAEFLLDIPQKEWHAGLISIGHVIFEIFSPHEFLLNARHGPHYMGVEYQADMAQVRSVLAAHGIAIARDIGLALHTEPSDCHGIAFEFYDGSFHERSWDRLGRQMLPPEHWRDVQGLGLLGLERYSVAVRSLQEAAEFYERIFQVSWLYDRPLPLMAAHARGYRLADSVIELIAPTAPGTLQTYLHRHGEGIRAVVFAIRDLRQAMNYFSTRGILLRPGDEEGAFGVPPQSSRGIQMEFVVR
jgi:Glyoxalase/Bleomycin resistance protein/Dioxygenase superfamily